MTHAPIFHPAATPDAGAPGTIRGKRSAAAVAALLGMLAVPAAPVAAQQPQVATVEITPARATLTAGARLPLRAVVRDAAGRELPGVAVSWFAAPFDAASVDSAGVFHAHRQGEAQVFALAGGRTGTALVRIEPKPPATIDLEAGRDSLLAGGATVITATARTEDGEPLQDARFTFRSSDERVAVVDQLGVVHGRSEGSVIIAVSSGAARTDLRLEVLRNRVGSLTVTGPQRARTGDVVRLRAAALDTRQLPMPGLPVRWSVSGAGASVDPDGGFVAERPGTWLVTATAGHISGSHAVQVAARTHPRRLELVGHVEFGRVQAAEVWAVGEVAYVSTLSDRIYVFDIATPSAPRLVDSLVVDARVINDISTTADGRIGVLTREGASSRKNGLVFLDLADPRRPKVLSEFTETLSGGVHSAFVDGRLVYATDDATGSLRIISFEDPARPREIGRWAIPEAEARSDLVAGVPRTVGRYLHDVQVVDGLAYLAYWRHGLVILDVGNGIRGGTPANPRLVSRYTYNVADYYPAHMIAGAHAVFRAGRYLYLADEVYPPVFNIQSKDPIRTLGRVHVLDVSDIARPVKVAEYNVRDAGSHNLWVEDEVMYIGYYEGGLRAVDVSGELRGDLMAQGREIGVVWTGSPGGFRPNLPMTWGAQPHRGHIWAGDMNSGLWVARLTEVPVP